MEREFKNNDIIRAYGYEHTPNRLLVVQNVNIDGSLYCWDMPKSWFGRRSLYGRPISEFPSVVIEQNNAVKIGYLVEREGYMDIIMIQFGKI